MKQQNHKRSGIFLLEIMIAILFFALTGAVCLRTFVKAHTLNTQATETEQALSRLEDVAGLLNTIDAAELKDEKTFSETLENEFPACEMDGRNAVIYYDTDWKACLPEKHSTRFSYRQQIKKIPCAIFRSKLCASQKALPVYLPVNLLRNSQAGQLLKLHI